MLPSSPNPREEAELEHLAVIATKFRLFNMSLGVLESQTFLLQPRRATHTWGIRACLSCTWHKRRARRGRALSGGASAAKILGLVKPRQMALPAPRLRLFAQCCTWNEPESPKIHQIYHFLGILERRAPTQTSAGGAEHAESLARRREPRRAAWAPQPLCLAWRNRAERVC